MDGVALLAEIRRRRPDTPILMIHRPRVRAGDSGPPRGSYDFVQKPIDRDYFVASLRRAIQAHALSRRVKDRELALRRCTAELEEIAARLGGEQPRVLIVDDDPALLQALPQALRLRMGGVKWTRRSQGRLRSTRSPFRTTTPSSRTSRCPESTVSRSWPRFDAPARDADPYDHWSRRIRAIGARLAKRGL